MLLSFKKTLFFLLLGLFTPILFASVNPSVAIQKLMARDHLQNISVGITNQGKNQFFTYGTDNSFMINSMTKPFTTLLLSYYEQYGKLNFSDRLARFMPSLKSTDAGNISLFQLATYTSGLPLNLNFTNTHTPAQFFQTLKTWHPKKNRMARIYSNTGIGLIGYSLEKMTQKSYRSLITKTIFKPFGMTHTHLRTTGKENNPATVLAEAADGIVSTAPDMIHFLEGMMFVIPADQTMPGAIELTLTSYFQTPHFQQAFAWQIYPWPINKTTLLQSATLKNVLSSPAKPINAIANADRRVLILKTGSGHGYSSIMAFVPREQRGVVILIHKEVSLKDRMALVYDLLKK